MTTEPMITVPLKEWLHKTYRHNAYAIIDTADFERVKASTTKWELYCRVENSGSMVGWNDEVLPQLEDGLFRLWNLADYTKLENQVREAKLKQAERQAESARRRNVVRDYYISQGLGESLVATILNGLSVEAFQASYDLAIATNPTS